MREWDRARDSVFCERNGWRVRVGDIGWYEPERIKDKGWGRDSEEDRDEERVGKWEGVREKQR